MIWNDEYIPPNAPRAIEPYGPPPIPSDSAKAPETDILSEIFYKYKRDKNIYGGKPTYNGEDYWTFLDQQRFFRGNNLPFRSIVDPNPNPGDVVLKSQVFNYLLATFPPIGAPPGYNNNPALIPGGGRRRKSRRGRSIRRKTRRGRKSYKRGGKRKTKR
jgi:hypothetical protein